MSYAKLGHYKEHLSKRYPLFGGLLSGRRRFKPPCGSQRGPVDAMVKGMRPAGTGKTRPHASA